MFRINTRCDLTSVKVRKEKYGDKRVLAVDLKLIAIVHAAFVADLIGVPYKAFSRSFWDQGEGKIKMMPTLKPLRITTSLNEEHGIELQDASVVKDRCKIMGNFVANPIDGEKCELEFRVAISKPSQKLVELVAACLQETVNVTITPDDELPLDHSEAGKSDDGGEDDEPLPLAAEQSEEDDAQASAESGTVAVDGSAPDDQIPEKIRKAWEEEDRQRAAAAANG